MSIREPSPGRFLGCRNSAVATRAQKLRGLEVLLSDPLQKTLRVINPCDVSFFFFFFFFLNIFFGFPKSVAFKRDRLPFGSLGNAADASGEKAAGAPCSHEAGGAGVGVTEWSFIGKITSENPHQDTQRNAFWSFFFFFFFKYIT